MRVTLADVISVNGKITRGDDSSVHTWSSSEDWEHFKSLRAASDVIIIDRKTYETVRPTPEPGKLRVIFTSTPEKFAASSVPGQLEFVKLAPATVLRQLAKRGYKAVLLAGGARLTGDFLAASLVDEMYISFEPVIFGKGRPMAVGDGLDVSLRLQSVKQLNEQGTLLAHYSVIKTD